MNFEIILWTDEHSLDKLKTENLFKLKDIRKVDFINADIIHNESFVAKSDLMRYEVLCLYCVLSFLPIICFR